MNVGIMRNSIYNAILAQNPDDVSGITDSILLIVLAETWTHGDTESLRIHDLTDAEFRTVVTWFHMTRKQYDNKIRHIKDMREVFPGLGLAAANEIVRG